MFWHHLRFGLRALRRNPLFAAGSALTLALGIGAATAMFSVVNGVFLEPLPYASPERLVHVRTSSGDEVYATASYPDFSDIREQIPALDASAAWQSWAVTLTGSDGQPSRESGASVSAGYFDLVGVSPAAGRFFAPDEGTLGHSPVVVLSHPLWQSRFGGSVGVLGTTIDLEGEPYTVVGVAPPGFVDPVTAATPFDAPEIWRARPPIFDRDVAARSWRGFWVVGRLAPGRPIEDLRSQLNVLAARLEAEYPDSNTGVGFRAFGIAEMLVGPVRPAVTLLAGAVVLVLLVSCANVANLLLSRAFARSGEIAVRRALGASHRQILVQLVTESLVLSMAGALLAVPVAAFATRALVSLASESLPRADNVVVDLHVLAFAALISLVSGLVFGLAPAVELASRSVTSRRNAQSLKRALVIVEIGVATALLVVSGLLVTSFWQLSEVETGIDADALLTFRVTPSTVAYPEPDDLTRVVGALEERLRAIPGTSSVGAVSALPFSGRVDNVWVWRADRPEPAPGERPLALARAATDDYFRTMGIALVRGRSFGSEDRSDSPRVTIINETLAGLHFGDEDPVGRSITSMGLRREIVGVVADVTEFGRGAEAQATFYSPLEQERESWLRRTTTVVMRSTANPALLAGAAREAVRLTDPSIPVHDVRTMNSFLYDDLAAPRFQTVLLSAFATVTLSLAVAGVVSLLSFTVSQRRKEIAVRIAVGAESRNVLGMFAVEGAKLLGGGAALGALAAVFSRPVVASLLFGASSSEPAVVVTVLLILLPVGALATLLPAWHASRIEPAAVLRGN